MSRNLLVALMLGIATLSLASTTLVRVVHADTVDCSQDENKDKDECKK
jgi:hypothetical protein